MSNDLNKNNGISSDTPNDVDNELLKTDNVIIEAPVIVAQETEGTALIDAQTLSDIEEIQAAIEAANESGQEVLDEDTETAAGDLEGGGDFSAVSLARDGLESIASSDFSTAGLDIESNSETITENNARINIVPVANDDAATVSEDGRVAIDILFNDNDLDGEIDPTSVIITTQPTNGTLTVDPITGEVIYTPNANYNGPDSFTYTVQDNSKTTSNPATVNLTVTAVNDAPIAVVDTDVVEENSSVTVDVLANDTDVDANQIFTLDSVSSPKGTVSIDANDQLVFVANAADFDHLAAGVTEEVVVTYVMSDQDGVTSTSTATITVTGTNDAPVLTVADIATSEDGQAVTGEASFTDVDLGDNHVYSVTAMPVNQGTVSIDSGNGKYTYNPGSDFQSLAAGVTTTVTFDVTVDDGLGGKDTQTVTVTITGTNDAPELTVTDIAATEDGIAIKGNASFSDVDTGDVHSYSVTTMPADQGSVSIDSVTGEYTYNPGTDFQSLAAGVTTDVTFDVTVNDGQGGMDSKTVTVTITGTNDGPIAVADSSAVTENLSVTVDVLANDTDLDDNHSFTLDSVSAPQGTASIDANNQLVFTATAEDFDHLEAGATQEVTVTYVMSDENGAISTSTATITVTGTNDAPIATADTGAVAENLSIIVDVLANDTDVDDNHSFTLDSVSAPKGTVSVDANNQLVFTANADDFDHLALGVTEEILVTYVMSDEDGLTSTSTVTITVTGTNDGPIAVADSSAVTENLSVTVDVLANDTDLDDNHSFTLDSVSAPQGSASIDVNNQLVFTATAADFDHLEAGATQEVVVTYVMSDENGATSISTVTITVTGTNDAPIATADTATVTENLIVTVDVLANDTDVDDNHSFTLDSVSAPKGTASIDANNQLVFTANAADFDHLALGVTEEILVTYVMSDEDGLTSTSTVTITVTGTNDAPIAVADRSAVDEDATVTVDVLANDTDLDDNHSFTLDSVSSPKGTVSIDANNQLVFTANPADFNHLASGVTEEVVVTYVMKDENGATSTSTATITVTGTNDAPVLTVTDIAASEDGQAVTGEASFTDVDLGDNHVYSVTAMPANQGTVSIDSGNGKYTYNPGSDFQSLAADVTTTVTFDVTVDDELGGKDTQTVTVTITGTNDAPELTVTNLATTEDGVAIKGNASFTDVDNGDSHTYSVTAMPADQGTVSINSGTGEYTYNPGADFQSLAAGVTTDVTFDVMVDDGQGGIDTKTVTVTITGTNDAPELTVTNITATEDGATVTGEASFTDVDLGDNHVYSVTAMPTNQGIVSIDSGNGKYTYNPGSDFQSLAAGVTTTVTFDVTVDDGLGGKDTQTVTVTITGTNDKPELSVSDISTTEDGLAVKGKASFTDVDNGDSHTYSVTAMPADQGTVSINSSTGEYTYTPGDDFQNLAVGTTLDVTFDVMVDDGQGGTDSKTVTVTITGTNDGPIAIADTDVVTENLSVTVDVLGNDTDVDDNHSFTLDSVSSPKGTVSIDANNQLVFVANAADFDHLEAGATEVVVVTYVMSDENGVTSTSSATITVTGTNDAPIATADTSAVEQNLSLVVDVLANDTDVDDNHSLTLDSVSAPKGAATIDANGQLVFNTNADFNYLAAGVTEDVIVTYIMSDENGATSTSTVTITVTGTNDKPELTVVNLDAIEDGTAVKGNASFSDVDAGDNHTYSVTTIPADQGTVSIDSGNGEYTYNPGSNFQSLAAGAKATVTFDVTVDDGQGGTDTKTVTVTITGTNDLPELTVTNLAAIEDGDAVTGTANFTDVDNGDTHTYSVTAMPADQGSVSINSTTGEYTYNPGGDFQSLPVGATEHVTFDVTVNDGQGGTDTKTVTVTITGTNDAPELTVANIDAIEDGVAVKGNASFTDVDTGDDHTYSVSNLPANQGTVSIDSGNGQYTYDPGTNFQSLAAGATTNVTFDVTVSDGKGGTDIKTVTVTITGTNDLPELTVTDLDAIEDGVAVKGSASVADVDATDVHTYSVTAMPDDQGSVSINSATGEYTYNPGADFQSLAVGETQKVSFQVTVDDGQGAQDTQTITVTITGTNDAPELTVTNIDAIEDGVAVKGNASFTDIDAGGNHTYSVSSMSANQGTVSIDSGNGQYTYDPGTDFQSLAAGVTTDVTFDVTVDDGEGGTDTETVTVTITGTNDAPELEVFDRTVTEDQRSVKGKASFTDVDLGDTHTFSVTPMPDDQGSVKINKSTGKYTFKPGQDFQYLAVGETAKVTFDVTINDGQGGTDTETVTITITGANDAPKLTVNDMNAIEDGGAVTGEARFTDVDLTDGHSYSVSSIPANQGTVSIDSGTGKYTYNPGDNFQSLAVGATTEVTFEVTVDDGNGGTDTETVTVTITGTNDAPELTVADISATEDGVAVQGNASFTEIDIDADDAHSYSVTAMPAGQGTVIINQTTGEYTYKPGSDFQSLAAGATTDVTFEVTIDDGKGGTDTETVTVTITGTNDAPELAVVDMSATEDGAAVTASASFTDIDIGDGHFYAVTAMPANQGMVSINILTGEYTYTPGTDFQYLSAGATTDVTFDVTVYDGQGGTDTQTVTVTITGTNDFPELTVVDITATEDGGAVTGNANFSDIDAGDAHAYSVTPLLANQGTVSINEATGQYTYNPGTNFQHLSAGETTQVTFDVTVNDGRGGTDTQTVTVTITGTNDLPELTVVNLATDEDGASVIGNVSFTDSDTNDTHSYSVTPMLAGQGTVSINSATGEYIYNPGADFQSLALGTTTDVSFDVTVSDGKGGTDTQTVTVTITGQNDAPELTISTIDAIEGGGSVTGTSSFIDVDIGDAHFYSISSIPANQGVVSINAATGEYTYNAGGNFNSLAEGETTEVTFSVTVDDRNGGTDTETVTVTITGTNDAPRLSVSALAVDEDGGSVTGNASFSDIDTQAGDVHIYSVTDMPDNQGSVSINPLTGEYTYNPDADFQSLPEGTTTTVSFQVTVTDSEGGSDTKTVTVTITGTNDAPALTVTDIEATEDGASVIGLPSFTDVDTGDAHAYSVTSMPEDKGSVSIYASTGQYTYDPGTDFQHLGTGETEQVSFDITVVDSNGGTDTETVIVTITGTNDAPILTVSAMAVMEDGAAITGSATFTDVDSNDSHFFSVGPMPENQGSVSINPSTGVYTYNPGTDFQNLATGATTDVTFDVTVDDGKGGTDTETVTITITGTNDAPVLTVTDIAVTEDGITATGIPSFTDVDSGKAHAYSVSSMPENQGSVSIYASTGQYTYNPGDDFQHLAAGVTTQVTFEVTVVDGEGGIDTEIVTVTITGTNDAPILTLTAIGLTEGGMAITGSSSFTDVDDGDIHVYTVTEMPVNQGTVTIDSVTGQYTYRPGSDFQNLALGETATVIFNVTVHDGQGGTDTEAVKVTITGTDDIPDLNFGGNGGGDTNHAPVLTIEDIDASEDGGAVTGNASFSDVDTGDNHTYSVTDMPDNQGSVTIDPITGEYIYDPGTDFQDLAAGATTEVSFEVTVDDGQGGTDTETVTVIITGTNDLPELTVTNNVVNEGGDPVTGSSSFTDVDLGDAHAYSVTPMLENQGSVTIDASTGEYTYDPGADFQYLGTGETADVTFEITVNDGQGGTDTQTVTITVTGTNNAPILTVDAIAATEDGPDVTGNAGFTDADSSDVHTYSVTAMPANQGSVTIDPTTGKYTYSPGSDFQSLAAGATTEVSFDVTIDDGKGGTDTETVIVTITGTNEDAELTVNAIEATEDGGAVVGNPTFTDIDIGDAHAYSVTAMPDNQGSVSIYASTGQYTYNPGSDFQYLAKGETAEVTFDVMLDDGEGGVDIETVTVTITGTNDAPRLTIEALSTVEDGTAVVGNASFTDVDSSDSHTYSVSSMPANQGTVSIDSVTGEYTYNPGTDFQDLATGATTHVFFDVTVDDGQGGTTTKTVTVTVTGTNEAPELTVEAIEATEDGSAVTGIPNFVDVDAGDLHFYSVSAIPEDQGTVSIYASTGEYTYNPGNNFQYLAAGETTEVSFDVTVNDGKGGTDTETVIVTITGTNDLPELTVAAMEATEDAGAVTGSASFTDVDISDVHTYSVTSMPANQGVVSINASTGEYSFDPGSDFQSLAAGVTTNVTFEVTVHDGQGGTDTQTVTVTITGSNDSPELTVNPIAASEDGAAVTGSASFIGIDSGDAHAYSVSSMPENQGSVSIFASTGEYTYNPGTDFQHLAAGETTLVSFDVTVSDGKGGTDTETVIVTITGTNDTPELSVTDIAAIEDAGAVTGSASFIDVDDSDAHTYSVSSMPANQGVVSINALTGQYTFNPGDDFQNLALGVTTEVSFDVTVDDDKGGTDTQTVTVTITGTNDAPDLTIEEITTAEDGASVTGTASVDGIDVGDAHSYSISSLPTDQGTVSIDASTGKYTYNPGANFQSLASGETTEVFFDVTVSDGKGGTDIKTVTVTITGTNDVPLASVDTASVDENLTVIVDVLANDTDLDVNDVFTIDSVSAPKGTVSVDANNQLVFTANALEFDHLEAGQTEVVVVTYVMSDKDGITSTSTATITITGTNDAPIAVADTGALAEDASISIDVLANDTDVDDNHSFTLDNVSAPKGVATIDSNGKLAFVASGFDHLEAGETEDVIVTYIMSDEDGLPSTSTVTITVTGTNDAPIAVADTGAVVENVSISIDVLANDTDVDANHSFTLDSVSTPKGTATIDANDQLIFTATDFEHLGAGQTEDVVVTYVMSDEDGLISTSSVTITVTGTNDAPIAVADTATVAQNLTINVDVLANDTDLDANHVFTLNSVSSTKGSASIVANELVFIANAAEFNHLAAGATEDVLVTYQMSDEHGITSTSTVTITITGTNDAPIATADVASVTEDLSITVDVLANDTDLDDNAVFTLDSVSSPKGTASIDANNQLVFDATDFDHLDAGETEEVVITYVMSDEHNVQSTSTVTITVTGTNDAPIAVADVANVTESATITVDVLVNDTDADTNHVLTLDSVAAPKGTASVDNNQLVFVANAAEFKHLGAGQTEEVIVTYEMSDEHNVSSTGTATITVTGTNDAPIANADVAAVDEDLSVTIDVLANDTDLDTNHVFTLDTVSAPKGSASVVNNQLVFTADAAQFSHLAAGETEEVIVTYSMSDELGISSISTVAITVTGTNDAPIANADVAAVTDKLSVTVDVLANDTDAESNHILTLDSVSSPKGNASVENNQLVFIATAADFSHLGAGQTEEVIVTYVVMDEHNIASTSTATITVTGTNDAPIANADSASVVENLSIIVDLLANDTDLDDNHSFTLDLVSAPKGTLSIDGNNQLVFDASDFDYLEEGETEDVVVTYVMSDENGAQSTSSAVITITGASNAPELITANVQATPPDDDMNGSDLLVGGHDANTLMVGLGDDTVTGGEGPHNFAWHTGDTGTDHITDFSSADGDTLDLSDLLHVDANHTLDDYLHFSSDGTSTTIEIFVDGDASEEGAVDQTIVLDGVNSESVMVVNGLFNGDSSGPLIIVDDVSADYNAGVVINIPDDHHL